MGLATHHTANFKDLSIKGELRLSVKFNKLFKKYKSAYLKFVNSTEKKEKFSDLISIEKAEKIKKGDVLFYPTIFEELRIFIATEKEASKFQNKTSLYKLVFLNKKITPQYLLNYFNHKAVRKFLSINAIGITFKHISFSVIKSLYIPLNSDKLNYGVSSVELTDIEAHKDILDLLIEEYQKAKKNGLIIAELSLMGAIVENLLIQELINNNTKIEHLEHYNGLKKLVDLSNIEGIFKNGEIKGCFSKIQNARNFLHPKQHLKKIKDKEKMIEEAKEAFEIISKEFNLKGIKWD